MRSASLIVLAALLLAGCGFELRGEARLPDWMARTHLAAGDDRTVFVRELRLLLEANGVTVLDAPAADAATLVIESQRLRRQPLSVTGQARVREYLLSFELEWRLDNPAGEAVLDSDRIRISRDYSFDEREILAAQREEEFLREDLSRSMAISLMRRLEALSAQP